MKITKIIFLCLVIILTLGAVSASEDMDNNTTDISDETITEEIGENISEEPVNDTIVNNTSEKEITSDDFYVYVENSFADEDDEWYEPKILVSDFPKNGTLKIFINNKEKFSKNIVAKNGTGVSLGIDDIKGKLGMKTSGKDYAISIKYVMNNKTINLKDYRLYRYSEDSIYVLGAIGIDDGDPLATVQDPSQKYISGTVKVTVNGKQIYSKKIKSSKKIMTLYINSSDILKSYKYGKYTVKVTYTSDKGKTYSSSRKVELMKTIPTIDYPYSISAGENQYITVKAAKGTEGTLSLYQAIERKYDEEYPIYQKDFKMMDIDFVDGYGKIPLNNLTKGHYNFIVEYKISGCNGSSQGFYIEVYNNHKDFSANLTPLQINYGETFKLNVHSPKLNRPAYLYVDNEYYSTLSLKTGDSTKKISDLKVGNHTITVKYDNGNKYFSESFDVVVKKSVISLKLDKVKVKKSASKLKISATLKIKGKIAKSKKVKFKFNKKTFVVKTNKKGIAKITVTKKILKSLKVGKKITYQASYGKITAKKTVKVLK